jgi:glucokinase
MIMEDREYSIAVDLGGTNIVTGLLNSKCKILARDRRPTMVSLGVNDVIRRIVRAIEKVVEASEVRFSQIKAIGVASPGFLDTQRGIIIASANLTGWKNVPLKDILETKLKLPVVIGHDAAMATLGEKYYGAGIGVSNFVCVTIGTGVGIGIIINGELYERSTGDLGHMTIDRNGFRCNYGGYGCLERLVGGPQIAARAIQEIKWGRKTLIKEIVNGDLNIIEAKTVFEAARKGDEVALEIVEEIGEILAIGIINVIALLNPELFIIGGMIAQAGDTLFNSIRRAVVKGDYFKDAGRKIVLAKLGGNAGIMGIAHLVMEKL